ncbi:MAG: ABC transporter permease [Mesorhizobium sp.]
MQVIANRLAQAIPTIACVLVVNFFLVRLIPGDPVDAFVAKAQAADALFKENLRHEMGLDQPIWVQFGIYLWKIVHLDFGWSFQNSAPVLEVILSRLWPTVLLVVVSIALSLVGGVVLGVTAARYFLTWKDRAIAIMSMILYAMPAFWIGLSLIVVFSVKLRLVPVGGFDTIGSGKTGLAYALDVARHMVLPAATLGLFYLAVYTRLVRASMLELLDSDFVRTARAKGLSESTVLWRHMLPHALLPVLTMVGVQLGSLLSGAIVIETVFSWPGLGRLTFQAALQRDYNTLLAILLMSTVVVVTANLIVDLVSAWIDRRMDVN